MRLHDRVFARIGDNALALLVLVAPLVLSVPATFVYALLFDLPGFSSWRFHLPLGALFFPAMAVTALWALGATLPANRWPATLRAAAVLLVVLLPASIALVLDGIEGAFFAAVYSWPPILPTLPLLFPGSRASALKLVAGACGVLASLAALATLAVVVAIAETKPHSAGGSLFDGYLIAALVGLNLMGALWGAHVAIAFFLAGTATRRLRPDLSPASALPTALVDDLYVRGLIDEAARGRYLRERARAAREWTRLADRAARDVSTRTQARLLVVFGTLGSLLAAIGTIVLAAFIAACSTSERCWAHAETSPWEFGLSAHAGGTAIGLGISAILAGMLALRSLAVSGSRAEAALDELREADERLYQSLLRAARSRHGGGTDGGADLAQPP